MAKRFETANPTITDVVDGITCLGMEQHFVKSGNYTAMILPENKETLIVYVVPGRFSAQEMIQLFADAGLAA